MRTTPLLVAALCACVSIASGDGYIGITSNSTTSKASGGGERFPSIHASGELRVVRALDACDAPLRSWGGAREETTAVYAGPAAHRVDGREFQPTRTYPPGWGRMLLHPQSAALQWRATTFPGPLLVWHTVASATRTTATGTRARRMAACGLRVAPAPATPTAATAAAIFASLKTAPVTAG